MSARSSHRRYAVCNSLWPAARVGDGVDRQSLHGAVLAALAALTVGSAAVDWALHIVLLAYQVAEGMAAAAAAHRMFADVPALLPDSAQALPAASAGTVAGSVAAADCQPHPSHTVAQPQSLPAMQVSQSPFRCQGSFRHWRHDSTEASESAPLRHRTARL